MQKYDICHRLELLYKGTGSVPIFPATVELLAEFYTPAFERIPPPEADQESFVIVGDSALALSERWGPRIQSVRSGAASTASRRSVLWARIQLPDEGETGFHLARVWSGNDVYGTYGYMVFTWHHVRPWIPDSGRSRSSSP